MIGSESIGEEDQGSEITHFLEGYRQGRIVSKKISGPSFMQFINSLIGFRLIFLIVFVVVVMMLFQSLGNYEEDSQRPPSRRDIREEHGSGDKED